MLVPCPSKYPHEERFPVQYAVAPFQHPDQVPHEQAAKTQGKQQRQKGPKVPSNQATMDQYLGPRNTQRMETGTPMNHNSADTAATSGLNSNAPYPLNNFSQEPHGWD